MTFNLSLAPYPQVMRVYNTCMAIPAFADAHPSKTKAPRSYLPSCQTRSHRSNRPRKRIIVVTGGNAQAVVARSLAPLVRDALGPRAVLGAAQYTCRCL